MDMMVSNKVSSRTIAIRTGLAGGLIGGACIWVYKALVWGAVFAPIWPGFRRRDWEATLLALIYAVSFWIVMQMAITIAAQDHPDYIDPVVISGGFMSHFFIPIPLALHVKRRLA